MQTTRLFRIKYVETIMILLISVSASFLSSCKEETEPGGPAYFNIENNATGLKAGVAGKTESFVVRSNRPWKIVGKNDSDWVKSFPDEGEDDGIFKIIVNANNSFEQRIMNFAFMVDGEEQPVLFRVEQDANVPNINVQPIISIPAAGGNIDIDVASNVSWSYIIGDNNWLSEVAVTSSKVTLAADRNNGSKRTVTLTVSAVDYPDVSQTVTLEQSPGSVVLEENFDWLAYGSAVPYTTTGETHYGNWTQQEKDKGWTSTVNTVTGSGNTPLCYARQGFVKLGKTSYGGDIISPKLSNIEGTKNVRVTFKAAAYVSAGGTVIDTRVLKIFVLGAGTPSTDMIMVENVPNTQAEDNAGVVNDIWDPARAFSFTITGATSETQIKFLGKDYDLRNESVNTNRIFLDDIKVEIIE